MQKIDMGLNVGGIGNLNFISHVAPDPEHPELRRYWTGGRSSGRTPMATWPDTEIHRARHGNVTVRLYAFADDEIADKSDTTSNIARIVSSAVSIWPGPDTRAEVDLRLVPADVSYQYARLITWREGMPFRLTLFLKANSPGDWTSTGETAAHELFHVMTGLVGRRDGREDPNGNRGLLNMTNEAFAEIFAACGSLLVNGEREIRPERNSLKIDDKTYQGRLTGAEIRYFFEHYADTPIMGASGPIMAGSAFRELYGDEAVIHADDPAGQRMLALCSRVAPDHTQLADWLRSLDP